MTQTLLLELSVAVLFLPLVSFLILIFFGKKLPRQGDFVGLAFLGVSLALSVAILYAKISFFHEELLNYTFTWIDLGNVALFGSMKFDLGVMIDNLTAVMLVVVTLISFLVHLFSTKYMAGDIRYSRYYAYLGIFSFSMLGIVIANNFLSMYIFWELVGLSSYLLIGHWYEKKSASDASKKAFVTNRVGDFGFFIGIMILWANYHTLTYEGVYGAIAGGLMPFQSSWWMTAAGILIFCGAVGKSAQFPLHVWLPDAMEGPTPVSALIHAATMVAAGVYLIARTFPMLTADALMVIAYVGAITAFISATIAIAQNDIKKVLAYSTVSQLGYMVMGLGVGAFSAGTMHLVTHAAFKAGLFLGSGSVIHAMHNALHHMHDHHTDAQDIRNMGGLRKKMPFTFWTFVIFTIAISGVPLTSGFLSKDAILAGTIAYGQLTGHMLIPIIGFLVAGLTAFYMFRIVILAFMGEHKDEKRFEHVHESPLAMTLPLMLLAVLSFFAFYSLNPFTAAGGWFFHAIERPETVVPAVMAATSTEVFEEAEHHAHMTAMILSLIVAGLGILIAFTTYYWKKINADAIAAKLAPLHLFLLNKWYFDELYEAVAVNGTKGLARVLAWFDSKVIDGIVNAAGSITKIGAIVSGKFDSIVVDGFVNLTATVAGGFGLVLRKVQTGRVQSYIVFAILGIVVLFFVYRAV
ncbi:MAG TPA: NADH-quinone oxidoreductase subunit L [Bacteroidota bacterium]|nr:NADH-quinone oxidoreductase subunit L [Bacteroidota bacterium]